MIGYRRLIMKGTVKHVIAFVEGKYVKPGYAPVSFYNWEQPYDPRILPVCIYEATEQQIQKKQPNVTKWWRSIWRRCFTVPERVLVIGKTYLKIGYSFQYDEWNQFYSVGQLAVWRVVPYSEDDNRYYKPFTVIEPDIFNTRKGAWHSLTDEKAELLK
jgi:hypothetical protein